MSNTAHSPEEWDGLKIRDHFAMAAILSPHLITIKKNDEAIACAAYDLADAMLKARRLSKHDREFIR